MRLLRIYHRESLVRELHNVHQTNITESGALVCRFAGLDVPGKLRLVVFAPRTWTEVQEWNPDPELAPELAFQRYTDDALPDVTGSGEQVGSDQPSDPDEFLTDVERVHRAMSVICLCDKFRCPAILNASAAAERLWWRRRQNGAITNTSAPAVEPLRRCVWEAGHMPSEVNDHDHESGHYWAAGQWPYGVANHHPECPRHPSRYNAGHTDLTVPGEGQPQHAAGVTPLYVDQPEARGELVRPYVKPDAELSEVNGFVVGRPVAVLEGDPTGLGYSRDAHTVTAPLTYNHEERDAFNICAEYTPGWNGQLWCTLDIDHEPGHSTTQVGGGDLVRW